MPTDPATIPLPGDEPERHVRLCDIPDTLRELREAAERYRGLYAQQLTEAGRLERLLGDARSTVEAQAATIHDLQREVYRLSHDETAEEIKRQRVELRQQRTAIAKLEEECRSLKSSASFERKWRKETQEENKELREWLDNALCEANSETCETCQGEQTIRDEVDGYCLGGPNVVAPPVETVDVPCPDCLGFGRTLR